jgi:hypothetical protein
MEIHTAEPIDFEVETAIAKFTSTNHQALINSCRRD